MQKSFCLLYITNLPQLRSDSAEPVNLMLALIDRCVEHDMRQNSVLIMWNQEQMHDKIVKLLENASVEVFVFVNAYTLTITTDNEKFQRPKREARKRGVKLRYITEITRDNLPYCKRQLDMVDELRHLDKITGNFLASESEFIASHEVSPQHPITEGFYSNVSKIVKLGGNIFETMWENAIPSADRIKQLEVASGGSSRPDYAIEKGKRKRVVDRFYVCPKCHFTFIYADEAREHQLATGHDKAKEFTFFDENDESKRSR